jgi:hypothetical protein
MFAGAGSVDLQGVSDRAPEGEFARCLNISTIPTTCARPTAALLSCSRIGRPNQAIPKPFFDSSHFTHFKLPASDAQTFHMRFAFSRRRPCVPSCSALGPSHALRQVRKQGCRSGPAVSSRRELAGKRPAKRKTACLPSTSWGQAPCPAFAWRGVDATVTTAWRTWS